MKSKKFIAILVTVCMMFSLLPTTALAYAPVSAGSYEELLEALDIIGDGETITKFSTFEMLGEASYAASIGATNYNTLQEAIDAATSGQAIALLQDCSESVNISGKSLVIERGVFDFDKSNITLGENCTLEESGTTLTITYVEPLTVTLLDIADAIAPINGGTPATVIAETDQYTGTVTWAGSPSQFSHSQTYTATITLTAKSGYNFEGIDANAFNVPCAMSATNGADSGVVTATFISPPEGYITDGNGTMAYCFNNFFGGYYNFDIMGFFHNGWKQTTCGNFGYGTQYKIGDSELTDIYATGEPLAMGSSGLTLDVDLVFVSEGKALQVVYTVHNTGTENVSFSFGSHADTQIGYTDWAPISIFDLNLASASLDRGFKMVSTSGYDANDEADYAQFNFFGKRSVGVTDVDSFWYGGYWERNSNVFTQVDATSYIGDSGMAYSWQNRTIGTGETQTYKVIIGIGGAESADVLGYSVAYDDNVPDTVIAVPETQQKLENIALTISEQIPVRSGFEFDSWNTQADGNGMVYHPGDTYAPNASITLYAQWTEVPTNNFSVTVTADPSGSIFVGDTVTLTATVTSATVPSINVMNRFSIMSPADPPSDLTYQWYRNTTDSATGGNEIPGAASSTYQPSTATVGTTYYYCVVNDVTSNVVGVTVTSVPVITYTITATAGANGSISPSGLVTVSNGGFQQFTITPNTGYYITDVRVDGLSVGAVSSYTFSNVTANHTISATFSYSGSSDGGSSSNDNSSPVVVTPPTLDKPNSPTQGETKVSGTVDSNGNVTVNITGKAVADVFDKAMAEAKKNGTEQNGITMVLRVDTGNKTGSSVTVNLPKFAQDTIIAKKIVNTIVVVDNPDIRIGMDLATVQEINKQAKSDVNIAATRTDSGKLTGDAKKAIGSRPVFDLKVNYGNGKAVSSFGAGSVSVTIPYTLGANENAGNVQAVYVDAKGKVHWLTNSVYDSVEKVLRFSTNHFSTYGIGYKQANTAFTDIAGHWAKEDIEFVVSRGLFSGTSETKFSPNAAMTRGMFVTVLGRLASADVSGYAKSSFSDVKSDAYYMGYIEWASKNNIVNGVGNGRFAPNQSITREQMAVIMSNYAKTIGYTLPKVHVENTFADNGKISAYAKEAVKQMQMAGVISGKNGNLFDPQGTATRAEVSAVLRRFVELAISNDTAQGWTMNDSGKWMYFKDGKPLTGKQDIDGGAYTFDQYGVTADVPKNLRYTTYIVQKGDSFWLIAHKLGCTMSELEGLNNKSRFSIIYPGDVLRVPEK